jgi:hypothetical protein
MKEVMKFLTTIVIWGAVVAVLSSTGVFAGGSIVWVALFMAIGAGFGTAAVWVGAEALNVIFGRSTIEEDDSKSKRGGRDRILRLIEEMDDDELRQFGTALQDFDERNNRR